MRRSRLLPASVLFALVCATGGGLALPRVRCYQHIEGAYEITMGVLVLLWNIITLLSRVRR